MSKCWRQLAYLLHVIITLLPSLTAWLGSTSYVISAMFVYGTKTGTEGIPHDTATLSDINSVRKHNSIMQHATQISNPTRPFHWHANFKLKSQEFAGHSRAVWLTTDPEEFPALLDHVCQAMSGGQVLIQVSLVRLSQCLLPVHHPLTIAEGKDRWMQQE